MPRKYQAILCASLLVCAGCSRKAAFNQRSTGMAMLQTAVSAAPRYVAVRHKLQLIAPGSELVKSVEAVAAFCGTIQCEVLSSSVVNETRESNPSGSLSMRVAPGDLNKLLDFAGKRGKVVQHSTESEDKTASVIDVEARLKNLTDFRDNLRKMVAKPGASVADLVQIQEKLSETQSEVDSEATKRKFLSNETEKVAVDIDFRAEKTASSASVFAPIGDALSDFGSVLADSLAVLITAIAAIIPWLIVIVPGIWFLVRLWRRWRKKRAAANVVPPT